MKLIKQGSRLVIVCTIKSWTMSSSGWWLGWVGWYTMGWKFEHCSQTPWDDDMTSFLVSHTIVWTALSRIKDDVWAGSKQPILSWMLLLRLWSKYNFSRSIAYVKNQLDLFINQMGCVDWYTMGWNFEHCSQTLWDANGDYTWPHF